MLATEQLYTPPEFAQFIALPENADRRFELMNQRALSIIS